MRRRRIKVTVIRKPRVPSEHEEQVAFVTWFKANFPGVMIFSIPNGGKRNIVTACKMKAEGQLPGVADLYIPKLRLWIEMKRTKGGSLSQDQKYFRDYVTEQCGDSWLLAKGKEHGRELFMKFYCQPPQAR